MVRKLTGLFFAGVFAALAPTQVFAGIVEFSVNGETAPITFRQFHAAGAGVQAIFPIRVEDDDATFLDAEAPEPGSFFLLGAGLTTAGLIRRRKQP